MEQTRTKSKLSMELLEKIRLEKKRHMELINAPELTEEAKDVLVSIKMGLEDIEKGRGFTIEEIREFFLKEEHIWE